ncbi:MAG TPA: hypothetical protein VGA72_07145 [Anaerolineales bacterium]|jgi:hypothetical protein
MPPYMERQDGQLEFRHKYDPEEWFFPGEELVDGTVVGAMKAGMVAYEIR